MKLISKYRKTRAQPTVRFDFFAFFTSVYFSFAVFSILFSFPSSIQIELNLFVYGWLDAKYKHDGERTYVCCFFVNSIRLNRLNLLPF